MAEQAKVEKFETWGIVEIMGHQVYAGRISEATIAGAAFVRVDVPESGDRQAFTKFSGAGSIFCLTPTDEEIARRAADRHAHRPFSHLTVAQAALTYSGHDEPDGDEEGDDDFGPDERDICPRF